MSETANIHGTDGDNCTVVVPGLIAMRVIVGAQSPKGHACSNLVEQLQHYQTATGFQRENLAKAIPLQMARLASQ